MQVGVCTEHAIPRASLQHRHPRDHVLLLLSLLDRDLSEMESVGDARADRAICSELLAIRANRVPACYWQGKVPRLLCMVFQCILQLLVASAFCPLPSEELLAETAASA